MAGSIPSPWRGGDPPSEGHDSAETSSGASQARALAHPARAGVVVSSLVAPRGSARGIRALDRGGAVSDNRRGRRERSVLRPRRRIPGVCAQYPCDRRQATRRVADRLRAPTRRARVAGRRAGHQPLTVDVVDVVLEVPHRAAAIPPSCLPAIDDFGEVCRRGGPAVREDAEGILERRPRRRCSSGRVRPAARASGNARHVESGHAQYTRCPATSPTSSRYSRSIGRGQTSVNGL